MFVFFILEFFVLFCSLNNLLFHSKYYASLYFAQSNILIKRIYTNLKI